MPDHVVVVENTPAVVRVTESSPVVQVLGEPVVKVIKEGAVGPRGIDTNINKMTADTNAPADPAVNDLWIDIS